MLLVETFRYGPQITVAENLVAVLASTCQQQRGLTSVKGCYEGGKVGLLMESLDVALVDWSVADH